MPFSPRWLVNKGRDEEALAVLSSARNLPPDNELIQIEFLEIRAQHLFEQETSALNFPEYQDRSLLSNLKLGFYDYLSLLRSKSKSLVRACQVSLFAHQVALFVALLTRVIAGSL